MLQGWVIIGSRYCKSQLLGGLVTVIAVLGVIPYISLRLKAISSSFTILRNYPKIVMPAQAVAQPLIHDSALYIALMLAAFTILFGTRHLDATERHGGLSRPSPSSRSSSFLPSSWWAPSSPSASTAASAVDREGRGRWPSAS